MEEEGDKKDDEWKGDAQEGWEGGGGGKGEVNALVLFKETAKETSPNRTVESKWLHPGLWAGEQKTEQIHYSFNLILFYELDVGKILSYQTTGHS